MFNPYAVLVALGSGKLTEKELAAASGTNWLGLTPGAVLEGLADPQRALDVDGHDLQFDIADLEAQRVRAVPLLLQTGLLTLSPGRPPGARVQPPNEYARQSLLRLLEKAEPAARLIVPQLASALHSRDRDAFTAVAVTLLHAVSNRMIKKGGVDGPALASDRVGGEREAVFHAVLLGALLASSVPGQTRTFAEFSTQSGSTDIVVEFNAQPLAVWVFEVGRGAHSLSDKMAQARRYTAHYAADVDVTCCAVVVGDAQPASTRGDPSRVFRFGWSRRESGCCGGGDDSWEQMAVFPPPRATIVDRGEVR